jgi:hypothetical protein
LVVKLKHAYEISVQALTISLNKAVHGPLTADSLFRRPWLARLSAWDFIFCECTLALAGPVPALIICFLAGVFYFLVFWQFGLNRFFEAWVSCFPAVMWCSN